MDMMKPTNMKGLWMNLIALVYQLHFGASWYLGFVASPIK